MSVIEQIKRSAVQIFSEETLLEKLNSGKKLKIKFGADPSRPDLHLGHTVILRQLKFFQDLGHEIIFVIGDFTAMIGDPSGKSKTRPRLTMEQTRKSGQSYFEQVTKILDPQKSKITYNSEWMNKLNFSDVIELAGKYTLARILERDDFANRFSQNQPLGLHELLYPLAQGYDSVHLNSDVEVGGTDQTFNLLVGRELQRDYGQQAQDVITYPLLVGLDGNEKMSKSLDNYIGICEPPEIMFEKAMKIPDSLLLSYFRLTTDISIDHATQIIKKNIIDAHEEYAREIIRIYHGDEFIENASRRYKEVASGQIPDNTASVKIPLVEFPTRHVSLYELVQRIGLASSKSEARRLVQQGGIKVNNVVINDPLADIKCSEGLVISRGKNKFVKVDWE